MRCQCPKTTPKNDPAQAIYNSSRTQNRFSMILPVWYVTFLSENGLANMVENVTAHSLSSLHLPHFIFCPVLQMEHHGPNIAVWALKVVSEQAHWRKMMGGYEADEWSVLESSLTLSWTLDIRFNHQNIHTLSSHQRHTATNKPFASLPTTHLHLPSIYTWKIHHTYSYKISKLERNAQNLLIHALGCI